MLSGLNSIKVCVSYKNKDKRYGEIPASTYEYEQCKPVYRLFPGWKKDISRIKKYADLPKEVKMYIKFIEKELKTPVTMLSIGAERKDTILL